VGKSDTRGRGIAFFFSILDGINHAFGRTPMSDWKNEDDIKAELRAMTDELRRLREGLRNMVSPPPKQNPSRAFLHRQSWPAPADPAPAIAPDEGPRKTRSKSNKKPR
jgi:hypothetical protein